MTMVSSCCVYHTLLQVVPIMAPSDWLEERPVTLVDWSYAIMESGHHCLPAVGLVTMRQPLPADSLATLNILVSDIDNVLI